MPTQYNAHAHCFTMEHVPENFFMAFGPLGKFLKISKLQHRGSFNSFFVWIITRNWVIAIFNIFSKARAGDLRRLKGLLTYEYVKKQAGMIDELTNVYGGNFGFVLLTMDMDKMSAGDAQASFLTQLEQLRETKKDSIYSNKIFPFIFADPRRTAVADLVKTYINDPVAPFSGIKIYPAMGYYPFDKDMRAVYEFAVNKNIPLLTHCIDGVVYFRDDLLNDPGFANHPITGKPTLKGSPSVFQLNFTHPLNYACLLDHEILKTYWGNDAPDLRSLKLCIGHFGGASEWDISEKQKKMIQKPKYENIRKMETDPLDIKQPWFGNAGQRLSWLTIIKALLVKYRNLYADISFTLAEDHFYFDELKAMLKDTAINQRILFGTDFYVVSTIKPEDEIWKLLQEKMDTTEIDMLTKTNPANFLNPAVNNYP